MNLKITLLTFMMCLLLSNTSLYSQKPTFEWAKNIGGRNSDLGYDITSDNDGNIYIVGAFSLTVDFDPGEDTANLTSNGSYDIFIQKLDDDGNLLWVKQIGGIYEDYGLKITTDVGGNVYITGAFAGTVDFDPGPDVFNLTATNDFDIHILKLDTDGNFLWAKQIGGDRNDYGRGIGTDSSGNVYVTGFFRETVDFDPGLGVYNLTEVGKSDIFLLKLDADGEFIWVKQMAGAESEFGNALAVDANNNLYITGTFKATTNFDPNGIYELTSAGNEDIFVLKMDDDGNLLWVRQMGSVGVDTGQDISVDKDGNVYSIGSFIGTVDFNPGDDTANLESLGGTNIYVQKLDTDGNFLWANYMGGLGNDVGYSISNDSNGNVYVAGHFFNNASFDSGAGLINLIAVGGYDAFVQKFDTHGNFGWLKQISGTFNDYAYSVFADNDGNIYSTGTFTATVNLNLEGSNGSLTSNGSFDCYILKLSVDTLGIEDSSFSDGLVMYPNPTKGDFSVAFKNEQTEVSVRLFSITGQVLMEDQFYNTKKIPLEIHQPNGLYFLEIIDQQANKTVLKIVKD
jgi:hypothetical protein